MFYCNHPMAMCVYMYVTHTLQVIKLLLLFLSLFIARDRKHHSLSIGSEVDDEEGKSAQGDDLEKMVVPKPTAKDKEADSDSDDDAFDNKSV